MGRTTGTPPPPPEEDLYKPPPGYQPPPAFTKPTTNGYEKPVAAQAFPPPQDLTPESFPPNQNIPTPAPFNPPPLHGVQVGIVAKENQPWKSNLFDCMKDPQNAIITLCFPCVTFGQIAEILDNGSTSCATSGILYSCFACCLGVPCLISCGYRSKLRAKFGLVESPAPDCLIHCFCEYCSLCQEYRELKDRGFDPSIGHAGNEARQRRQQFGVTPPMQQRMM
ncbi:protein PLANT CADMIUM RESISTANCE 7-like [Salvia hispanica]|uniref:protein PLANT CADMIUM RESISTANCE 7-like n=1 Tax=Salvia hispanica TaxID=49212 RepID=UPI0020097F67|nr:protein PLANT CADMIUM RESISTANCE 7-like [Salvia hispanica]